MDKFTPTTLTQKLFQETGLKVEKDDPVIIFILATESILDKKLATLDEKNEELNHILTQIQQSQAKESAKLKQREVIIGLIGFGFGLVVCMVFVTLSA